jgi:tetratricopeptide (TPR) repeat protein
VCRNALLLLSLGGLLFAQSATSPFLLASDTDTTPPTLRIVEPTTGTEVEGDALTVEIEYRDTGSGIAAQTLHVRLNGKDYAGQFDQHSRGAGGRIRLPKSLPMGDNKLTVEIADRAGNVAKAETLVRYEGPPEEQYNAGLIHAQAGRWKEAEASFSKAVKFDPKDADAYVQLGHVYQRLQRYGDAVTAYRQATTLRPDNLEAFLSLGDASMRVRDYAGATNAYRTATELDPKNPEAFKSLGIAYRADKKYPDAKQAFQKARQLNPQDADIYSHIGILELVRKNYLLAELSFKRAVLVNPKSMPAYLGLGEACFEQGRYEKAVEAFNQALQLNPRSAKARFALGVVYLSLKDLAKAQEQVPLLAEVNKDLSEELNRRLKE